MYGYIYTRLTLVDVSEQKLPMHLYIKIILKCLFVLKKMCPSI